MTDPTDIPPRPTQLTDELRRAAAARVVKELLEDRLIEETESEACIQELIQHAALSIDGYALARRLDDKAGWHITADMVGSLDGFHWHARSVLEQAQRAWEAEHDVKPPFPRGTRVRLKTGETGVIDAVYEHSPASYAIKIDGDPRADSHHARRIVWFENVSAV